MSKTFLRIVTIFELWSRALASLSKEELSARSSKSGLTKMHCPTALLLALVLTATAAAAAADGPLWQIPGRVSKSANPTTDGPDNQCSMSTFDGIGEGEILISDCEAILDALEGEDQGFILALSIWRDSTALEDHFWTYVTSGTCQFALKRVDGLNDTV